MCFFKAYESNSSNEVYYDAESSSDSEDLNSRKIKSSLEQVAYEIVIHQGTQFANTVLNWPCNSNSSASSELENCNKVPLKFTSLNHYKSIFKPLVKFECWDSLKGAKSQMLKKGISIKVLNKCKIDGWTVVEAQVNKREAIQANITEHDLLLVYTLSERGVEFPEKLDIFEDLVNDSCYAKIARTDLTDYDRKLDFTSPKLNGNTELKLLFITSKFENERIINSNNQLFALNTINLVSAEREYNAIDKEFPFWLEDNIVKGRTEPLFTLNSNTGELLMKEYNLNGSQAHAAAGTLRSTKGISMIHGPPGTGKTRTITAIIRCATDEQFLQKLIEADPEFSSIKPAKRILVCTPSNAAVDELVKRLNSIYPIDVRSPKVIRIGDSKLTRKESSKNTLNSAIKYDNIFKYLNKNGVEVEANQFNEDYAAEKLKDTNYSIQVCDLELLKIKKEINDTSVEEESFTRDELEKKLSQFSARKCSLKNVSDILISSGNELSLEEMDSSTKRDEKKRLKKIKIEIIGNSSVVCTTLSASVNAFLKDSSISFDIIIIDEANQCTEPSLLIPLRHQTSHVILVGDSKQLPPTVMSKKAVQEFNYEQSFLLRLKKTNANQSYFLDTQYRMYPKISLFPNFNNTFHGDKLINGSNMSPKTKKDWHNESVSGVQSSENKSFSDITNEKFKRLNLAYPCTQ